MTSISLHDLEVWLEAYGAAWRAGDAHAVTELFTGDAQYYETPFGDPMRGSEAISRYWIAGPGRSQREVSFSFQVLAVVGGMGIARWQASFVRRRSGRRVELDGCLAAEFAHPGKCTVFREWWHRREPGRVATDHPSSLTGPGRARDSRNPRAIRTSRRLPAPSLRAGRREATRS
jgi:ketosteroid isomerase-like protein